MKTTLIVLVLLLAVVGGISGLVKIRRLPPPYVPVASEEFVAEEPEEEQAPEPDVRLLSPKQEVLVSSPLPVIGEARGFWFFEASFPVRMEDTEGNTLGEGTATAQGEWMTEEYVPFLATLEFDPKEATAGVFVLMKDNPSGLPENDAEIRVPVFFVLP